MTDYATPAPSTVPAIDATLRAHGLGSLVEAVSPGGRSDNWLGTTTTGRRVFVKQVPRRDGGPDGFTRSLAHAAAALPVAAPALLGSCADEGLLVFAGLEDVESGVDRALAGTFGPAMSAAVGHQLALVHDAAVPSDLVDDEPSVMPPLDWLEAVPWEAVHAMNGAQLEAWRLLQRDSDLCEALVQLRRSEWSAPTTPIHGDLRLDQVIVGPDGSVQLCDWECFRRGDPARDIGAFVGEWIYHSVFRIFTAEDSTGWGDGADGLTHDDVMRRGNANLTLNAEQVRAFWTGYDAVRLIDDDLRLRSLRFAGWHVVDRFLAAAESQTSLHPVAKAAAGIGRTVLLDPATGESLLAAPRPEEVVR